MAANFNVDVINRYSTGLYLRVRGDFDGESAYRLTDIIDKEGKRLGKIVIDTNGLETIHPFGRDLFNTRTRSIRSQGVHIKFLGKFEPDFAAD